MNREPDLSTDKPSAGSLWAGRGIGAALIALAVLAAVILVKTRPKEQRRKPERVAPVVEVIDLQPSGFRPVIRAAGTVVPATEIDLRSEVTGRITGLHPDFEPGGTVRAGDVLLTIDPRDYAAALQQAEAALDSARSALRLEEGRQDVARREWDLLALEEDADENDRELALRAPQRRAQEAQVRAAEASLARARLNLERTGVAAPTNAVVLSRAADVGDTAAPGTSLARLAGTDRYWVRISVRVEELAWIRVPGSMVTVSLPDGRERKGSVIRRLPDLDPRGRMARLLVAVDDPLGLRDDLPPLLLNAYVGAAIRGEPIAGVCAIPRSALHNGAELWLLDTDNRLDIVKVQPVWGDRDRVLIEPDWQGDRRLIVSELATHVQGMSLQPAGEGKPGAPAP